MTVKLLTEYNLGFLSLKEGYPGSYVYIHVKMSHCWKSHVMAHFIAYSSLCTTTTGLSIVLTWCIVNAYH